jgi:hypothetical protein
MLILRQKWNVCCDKMVPCPMEHASRSTHLASFDKKETNHDENPLFDRGASNRLVVVGVCWNWVIQQ